VAETRNNAVFEMKYHLVLVTKYRRKALSEPMRGRARDILADGLAAWRCRLIEFGAEEDHVHLLFSAHPALDISKLVNNLKTVSSRRLRTEFAEDLKEFYWKPVLWHGAYYIGTVGGASLETVKRYVEQQGQDKWPAKRRAAHAADPLTPACKRG
jgi:putative transposase